MERDLNSFGSNKLYSMSIDHLILCIRLIGIYRANIFPSLFLSLLAGPMSIFMCSLTMYILNIECSRWRHYFKQPEKYTRVNLLCGILVAMGELIENSASGYKQCKCQLKNLSPPLVRSFFLALSLLHYQCQPYQLISCITFVCAHQHKKRSIVAIIRSVVHFLHSKCG